jgi:hypothetical protein
MAAVVGPQHVVDLPLTGGRSHRVFDAGPPYDLIGGLIHQHEEAESILPVGIREVPLDARPLLRDGMLDVPDLMYRHSAV